jgi:predicted 2-oxoglutarate/Fe(II)-dependent dioxygenase YbiX
MDHTEAIMVLNNVLSDKFREKIISLTDHKAKDKLTIKEGMNDNVRNVCGYHLNFESATNLFYWNYIKKEIERLYYFYKIKFPLLHSYEINQIDLLKYGNGGKYTFHTDNLGGRKLNRTLSVIMNLNNDYEGGDLIFGDQKFKEIKRIKLKSGSVVFFPSNFMYPHSIEPIIRGTRYSVVAWLN